MNLANAPLSGANLSKVNLSGANLSETDFREAKFSDVDLKQSVISDLATHIYGSQKSVDEIIPAFRIRILEEPLTPSNLLSALSVESRN